MDFDISGAQVFFTIPTNIPILGDLQISETMVVSWIVMAVIAVLCLWLTHDLKVTNISKRQAVAEFLVEKANNFVRLTFCLSWQHQSAWHAVISEIFCLVSLLMV